MENGHDYVFDNFFSVFNFRLFIQFWFLNKMIMKKYYFQFFIAIIFLFFSIPSRNAHAAVVLDSLTGSSLDATDIHCENMSDFDFQGPGGFDCILWRQRLGTSTSTKPFVSTGKLKSITLNALIYEQACPAGNDGYQ